MKRLVLVTLVAACGSSEDSTPVPLHLALIGKSVRESVPAGFASPSIAKPDLPGASFRTTFFETGPTNVYNILDAIDVRINGYNAGSEQRRIPCASQEPVSYTISVMGESITMYAQCYEQIAEHDFALFGVKDGVTYFYLLIGSPVAAIATPDATVAGKHNSNVFMSVGYDSEVGCATHTWYGCSYGTIHVKGNSATKAFEMTTAGLGFQYCGAHLKSDAMNVYAMASVDGGATCSEPETLCAKADELTTPGTCGDELKVFGLTALGRMAGTAGLNPFAASKYPASPSIKLDGTATDAVHFGPTAPIAGVGNFREQVQEPAPDGGT